MDKWHFRKIGFAFFLFFFLTISNADQVCKLTYTGIPEDINGETIDVPSQAVFMSEKVVVGQPTEIIEGTIDTSNPPSIFFVIDHSGSMYFKSFDNGKTARDRWGKRFVVTKDLIDTIQKTYPDAEVGISLFALNLYFDTTDDENILSNVTNNNGTYYKGGYIPLLKLNKLYTSSIGEKTGYEILTHYLQTDTSNSSETSGANQEYLTLDYRPTDSDLSTSNTNITAGFDAVKDAFSKSSSNNNDRYVIFFSDGDAKAPSNNTTELNKFKEGDNVPTTFTIFFTESDEVPGSIDTMTQNIKTNGYSDNNNLSNAWPYDNNENDTLMELLLENVFSIINTKSVSKPLEITVNGKKPDGKPIEINGEFVYTFSSTFAFEEKENDFNYEIHYEVVYQDTVDTSITHTKDTTIYSNFTINLTDGASKPDDFELDCWERRLEFYYNGNQITSANETMIANGIEIRFISEEVDTFYTYKDVKLEVINSNPAINGSPDKETFNMSEPDSFFSVLVPIDVNNSNSGDGKLQINGADEIIVIYKNPLLPLDTLRDTLPFKMSGTILMSETAYFDKKGVDGDEGADGLVDSIYITFENDDAVNLSQDDIDQLISNVQLPSYRDFEITGKALNDYGLSLNVNEKAKRCNTAIATEMDTIKLSQVILDHGGWINRSAILPKDEMAPVIVSARAIQYEVDNDSTCDSLIVTFSESVADINYNEPFLFLDTETDLKYNSVELSLLDNNKDSRVVTFKIDKINRAKEVINNGDSIWINTTASSVMDNTEKKISQQEDNNIKRVIGAYYVSKPFDIEVTVTGPIDFIDPDEKSAIDINIINILDEENLDQLKKTGDDEYHGLLIVGETIQDDEEDPQDIELRGNFAIYDYLGNSVWKASKMSFDDDTKTLYYVWNGKNSKGRVVGSGTYISVMSIETVSTISGEVTEERSIKKFLSVKN